MHVDISVTLSLLIYHSVIRPQLMTKVYLQPGVSSVSLKKCMSVSTLAFFTPANSSLLLFSCGSGGDVIGRDFYKKKFLFSEDGTQFLQHT